MMINFNENMNGSQLKSHHKSFIAHKKR